MNRLIKLAIATIIMVGLTACHSNAIKPKTSAYKEFPLKCDGGKPSSVRFYTNKELAVLVRDGQATELIQKPSGSGFFYTNGQVSIRGKGNLLSIEIGRMAPTKCRIQLVS